MDWEVGGKLLSLMMLIVFVNMFDIELGLCHNIVLNNRNQVIKKIFKSIKELIFNYSYLIFLNLRSFPNYKV